MLTALRMDTVWIHKRLEPIDPEMARFSLQMQQPLPEPQDNFTLVPQLLQGQGYDVRPIQLTEESGIPDDADVLVVMGPRNLGERQVWEINRVLHGGMPVIMALQAHEYGYSPGQGGGWTISGQNVTTGLEPMLAEFGLAPNDMPAASVQEDEKTIAVFQGTAYRKTKKIPT